MKDSYKTITSDLHKLATGSVLAFSGSILGNGIIYLIGIFIARLMGAEVVGYFFLALVFMQIVSAVCRVGLPEGLLRFVAIHVGNNDYPRVKGTIFSAITVGGINSLIASIFIIIFLDFISFRLIKQPGIYLFLKWFAVSLPFFSVFVLILFSIQAYKRMELVVLFRDIVQPTAMLVIAFVLYYYFLRSPICFPVAYFGSIIIVLASSAYFLFRISPALKRKISAVYEWKTLLIFSLPITLSDIAYYSFRWFDSFLISYFRTSSEIGIYNAALRTTLLLNLLAVSVNALFAPIIAEHHHQGKKEQINLLLKTMTRWSLTVALPIVFAMSLFSNDILYFWGPQFTEGSTALILLALAQLMFILSSLMAFNLIMCGKQYIEIGITITITIFNIIVNLLMIPAYGINGAAIAMLISQIIAFLLRVFGVQYSLGIGLYTQKYFKPILAFLPVLVVFLVLQKSLMNIAFSIFKSHVFTLVIMFLLIVIVYLTFLYILKFEKEDLLIWKELRNQ